MNAAALRSLAVLVGVALVCAILVSVSTTALRPIQERNQLLQRYRNVVSLTGQVAADAVDAEIFAAVEQLDTRVVDLGSGDFAADIDPESVNSRMAITDADRSAAIPAEADLKKSGPPSVVFTARPPSHSE